MTFVKRSGVLLFQRAGLGSKFKKLAPNSSVRPAEVFLLPKSGA